VLGEQLSVERGRVVCSAFPGHQLPADTYTVETPSGGRHSYFRQPSAQQLGSSAGRIGWKIDTRGHGGYVVGATWDCPRFG
jgi:hypothetical protein